MYDKRGDETLRGLVIVGITALVCIIVIAIALILFGIWMITSYIHSSEYKRLKEEMKECDQMILYAMQRKKHPEYYSTRLKDSWKHRLDYSEAEDIFTNENEGDEKR